jgi:hypothetical protein
MELNDRKPKRRRIIKGDVFSVKFEDGTVKYFQYVADDTTQLNSSVIRAFKHRYRADEVVDIKKIVKGEVEFFAHVFLRVGLKLGYWDKVGHASEVGKVDVWFRDSEDYGNPEVKRSEKWYVWKINEPFMDIGKLEGKYRDAEIGVVVAPENIVQRIRTGKYSFKYPGY